MRLRGNDSLVEKCSFLALLYVFNDCLRVNQTGRSYSVRFHFHTNLIYF